VCKKEQNQYYDLKKPNTSILFQNILMKKAIACVELLVAEMFSGPLSTLGFP